ncbi:DNA-formamidopyrimidine glycosylase [Vagococcus lutrae]|uniref:Formamidopyrimidine-DNA glycosylase n=1 Tax=Vagococcus lutrae TaxID=81947 RepID=A0AAE9XLW2_9ENTE|nr:DNA-formamidopyrimidine glycosylase [Vagococcus lutrae]RST92859.1 DNA-formamidopyrimidine glycosylase [Vagococcus lutrae]UQF39053.1 DNA-formamidopyrimidine glycosylase [Vagococcus lutrae]WCG22388.1 DNA-formamidopyrimidine glycosylase [Vagococcus lutrae]
MPELPEVEAVRTGLEQLVVNKTIESVSVMWPKIIETTDIEKFKLALIGESIEAILRRGKFLIIRLTHFDLISHLRMEGKYEFHQADDPLMKHTHVVFHFNDGTELRYLDVRKFGRMALIDKHQAEEYRGIKKLGPEPVLPDFNLTVFEEQLGRRVKAIKPLLLDQHLVTGLGNIYVDEALYQARIHPEQPANTLAKDEIEVLHSAIIEVLARAVAAGGTTIRTYKNALGEAGKFQVALKVYGQTGQACDRCQTPIKKIKVAQRGTHFCPKCQVLH